MAIAASPVPTPGNPTILETTPMDVENVREISAVPTTPSMGEPMDILDDNCPAPANQATKLPGGVKDVLQRAQEGIRRYFFQAKEIQEQKFVNHTMTFYNELASQQAAAMTPEEPPAPQTPKPPASPR